MESTSYRSLKVIEGLFAELAAMGSCSDCPPAYLAVAESILMIAEDQIKALKQIVFYGITFGFRAQDIVILSDTLKYICLLLQEELSAEDYLSSCSAKLCVELKLAEITKNVDYLSETRRIVEEIEGILQTSSHLKYHCGWNHFLSGKYSASELETAQVFQSIGRSFFLLYQKGRELADLYKSSEYWRLVVEILPNQAAVLAAYADTVLALGEYFGRAAYVEQAMRLFSQAIFLSFNRDHDDVCFSQYRRSYALAAVTLFHVTLDRTHFYQASQILYQTAQAFPQCCELWEHWGTLLIRFGWLNHHAKYVESGLDKLSIAQRKGGNTVVISGWLVQGIAMLGLYFEEPNFFKESCARLVSTLKSIPKDEFSIYSLGVVQLCSGIYFNDRAAFASAVSCFRSCLEGDAENIDIWHRLFDTYFSWGVRTADPAILKKAIVIVKRLCVLRPEAFLFRRDVASALKHLAEISEKDSYKEIYLEEALLYCNQAWQIRHCSGLLELWAEIYYLLADLQENLSYYIEVRALLCGLGLKDLSLRAKLIYAGSLLEEGTLTGDMKVVQEVLHFLQPLEGDFKEDERFFLLLGKAWVFFFKRGALSQAKEFAKLYLKKATLLGSLEAKNLLLQLDD